MVRRWQEFATAFGVLLSVAVHGLAAQSPSALAGIAVRSQGLDTRVDLTLTGASRVQDFALRRPDRIVLDLTNTRHNLDRTDFAAIAGSPIRGIRTSQFDANTVRVVIDVTSRMSYRLMQDGEQVTVVLQSNTEPFASWSTGATWGSIGQPDASVEPVAPPSSGGPAISSPQPRLSQQSTPGREPEVATVTADVEPAGSNSVAQEVIEATVTRIAGATVYLDGGTEAGVANGDTLLLLAVGEEERGGLRLEVLAASEGRSVLRFVGAPAAVTRGVRVRLAHERAAEPTNAVEAFARAFPEGADPNARGLSANESPQATGRLMFDFAAIQSTTTWEDSVSTQSSSRTFLTPTARLLATVTDLPGGFRLSTNMRGSYRHASGGLGLSTQSSMRVYELSADRITESSHLKLGRFYSPHESFSGYWDGGMVRVGSDRFGAGVLVGFQPQLWNESFSTELPKVSLFADLDRRSENGGVRADWSVHRVMPTSELLTHTFVGWAQRIWWKRLTLSHDLQVDQNPLVGGWEVSDFRVDASIRLANRTRVHGRYSRRKPYYLWETEDVFSYRRDGMGLGFSTSLGRVIVGGDVTLNNSDERGRLTSYSSSLQVPNLTPGLSMSSYATYWSDRFGEGLTFAPSFSRSIGRTTTRVGYRYYQTQSAFNDLKNHGIDGSFVFPLGRGLRATLQGSAQWGNSLRNYRFYSSFWKSF